jgi:hypothetical protein
MCFRHSKGEGFGVPSINERHWANLEKIKALIEMQDPTSVKDVQKMTGLNRFIPRAVEIVVFSRFSNF